MTIKCKKCGKESNSLTMLINGLCLECTDIKKEGCNGGCGVNCCNSDPKKKCCKKNS